MADGPQPSDTHPDAARVQLDLLRAATPTRRAALALGLSSDVIAMSRTGLSRAHPELDRRSLDLMFVSLVYGKDLAQRVRVFLDARAGGPPGRGIS